MFINEARITPARRILKATMAIMAKDRYVAMNGVFAMGDKRIEYDAAKCPTAYTDGINEVYGHDFVDSLSDSELRFLMLHECSHKMKRDLITWRALHLKNAKLANIAMDHVINTRLVSENTDGFATMTGPLAQGCCDMKYLGATVAQVFKDLWDDNEPDGGSGGGGGQPLDEHGWDAAAAVSEEEKLATTAEIGRVLRQGAMIAAKQGLGQNQTVGELLEPQVDWRAALRDFVSDTCTGDDYGSYARPNRRFLGSDVIMPTPMSDSIGELVVAPDTSGSIGADVLRVILTEVASIASTAKPEVLRLLYWDGEVQGDETYTQDKLDTLADSTKPVGGGGTNAACVPEYMSKNAITPQAAIVLTDGYVWGGWGDWPCPVLWVILDNKTAAPPFGKVLHIKSLV